MKKVRFILLFVLVVVLTFLPLGLTSCTGQAVFEVSYSASMGGKVLGAVYQSVPKGGEGKEVRAVPDPGYRFNSWSDGVKGEVRHEENVQKNLTLIAEFIPLSSYNISYLASEGGVIIGESRQVVKEGEYSKTVEARPNIGYRFLTWDDGITTFRRWDIAIDDISVTAIFVKEQHQAVYSSTIGGQIIGNEIQYVEYGDRTNSVTAVAQSGYQFICWSDGKESPTRSDIVKQDLEIRAIFAIETAPSFPVLMVFIPELIAELELKNGDYFQANYLMSDSEERLYENIRIKMFGLLNDVFAGEIKVDVDSYFTSQSVNRDQLYRGTDYWLNYVYGVNVEQSTEINSLAETYRSVLITLCLSDYSYKAHSAAGVSEKKFGQIYAESYLGSLYDQNITSDWLLDFEEPSVQSFWDSILDIYLHEFAHTAELYYSYSDVIKYSLHDVISSYAERGIYGSEPIKLYLIGEAVMNEEKTGVPKDFWIQEPKF